MNYQHYTERARQLLLSADAADAYVRLATRLDSTGRCPGCGMTVERYESSILAHIRHCAPLKEAR